MLLELDENEATNNPTSSKSDSSERERDGEQAINQVFLKTQHSMPKLEPPATRFGPTAVDVDVDEHRGVAFLLIDEGREDSLSKCGLPLQSVKGASCVDDSNRSIMKSDTSNDDEMMDISSLHLSSFDSFETACSPYAQLCFDADRKDLLAFMEVMVTDDHSELPGRVRMVGKAAGAQNDDSDSSGTTGSTTTDKSQFNDWVAVLSPSTEYGGQIGFSNAAKSLLRSSKSETVVFSAAFQEQMSGDAASDRYLLEKNDDPWVDCEKSQSGCTEAFRKLMLASKALVAARSRSENVHLAVRARDFSGIGYTYLHEMTKESCSMHDGNSI